MKLIAFLLSTLISVSAFANFTGAWKGQGDLTDGEGTMAACKAMSFDLTQTDVKFSLNSGDVDCDLFRMGWTPFSLDIQGEDLMSNGARVGSINEDHLFATQANADSSLVATYQADIVDGILNYKETVVDAEGNILYSIEGDLTK